eukprot:Lankesteria_metandrocarpae@DN5413_c0_g1_i16.p1
MVFDATPSTVTNAPISVPKKNQSYLHSLALPTAEVISAAHTSVAPVLNSTPQTNPYISPMVFDATPSTVTNANSISDVSTPSTLYQNENFQLQSHSTAPISVPKKNQSYLHSLALPTAEEVPWFPSSGNIGVDPGLEVVGSWNRHSPENSHRSSSRSARSGSVSRVDTNSPPVELNVPQKRHLGRTANATHRRVRCCNGQNKSAVTENKMGHPCENAFEFGIGKVTKVPEGCRELSETRIPPVLFSCGWNKSEMATVVQRSSCTSVAIQRGRQTTFMHSTFGKENAKGLAYLTACYAAQPDPRKPVTIPERRIQKVGTGEFCSHRYQPPKRKGGKSSSFSHYYYGEMGAWVLAHQTKWLAERIDSCDELWQD